MSDSKFSHKPTNKRHHDDSSSYKQDSKKPYKKDDNYDNKKSYDSKKPKALTREDRKDLRKERRSKKKHAETAEEVLKIFESGISKLKRVDAVAQVDLIIQKCKDKFYDLCLRHDTSRAIQLAIKHGRSEQRDAIISELHGKFIALMGNKTGHFVALKVVQYGSEKQKQRVIDECSGSFRKVATKPDGASVIDYLFMTATKPQQYQILREFFDNSYVARKSELTANSLHTQNENKIVEQLKIKSKADPTNVKLAYAAMSEDEIKQKPEQLLQWLLARNADSENVLMDNIELLLNRIIDKEMLMYRFFHAILLQYLEVSSIGSSSKREMLSSLCKYILALHDSKDGVACAIHVVNYATLKDRKNALKAIKGRVVDLCLHDHAYMLIVKLLDVTDDSVTLRKAILSELLTKPTFGVAPYLSQLSVSKPGAKVLYYLIAPHTSAFFSKQELEYLKPVFVPSYIMNKKPEEKAEKSEKSEKKATKDDDDEEDDGKLEMTDREAAIINKETEKYRLEKKANERAEAEANKDSEMVRTYKKDIPDKVFELASHILEPLLQTLLLTVDEATGLDGMGNLSTSNMDLSKQKKSEMGDEDYEEDYEEDMQDNTDIIVQNTTKIAYKPYAVLNGVMKHRVGLEVIYAAILCAYNYHTKEQEAGKKTTYASAVSAADAVLEGLSTLSAEGDAWDGKANEKKGTVTNKDGLGYSDDSHPFINSCSHLLLKRLFQTLPETQRDSFAKATWKNLSADSELLARLATQNRFGHVTSHMMEHTPVRSAMTKVLTKMVPKKSDIAGVALLRRVIDGGNTAKEEPIEEVKTPAKKAATPAKKATIPAKKSTPAGIPKPDSTEDAPITPPALPLPTPRRSTRSSSRIREEDPGLITPLRRSRRIASTPLASVATANDIPMFSLEAIPEEEEETSKPASKAKTPSKRRKTVVPMDTLSDDDDEEVIEEVKATRKTRSRK